MKALIAWVGRLLGTLVGGPGIAVIGDPGMPLEPADEVPSESDVPGWMKRAAAVLFVLAVVLFFGAPWEMLGVLGLIGLLFVVRPRWLPL